VDPRNSTFATDFKRVALASLRVLFEIHGVLHVPFLSGDQMAYKTQHDSEAAQLERLTHSYSTADPTDANLVSYLVKHPGPSSMDKIRNDVAGTISKLNWRLHALLAHGLVEKIELGGRRVAWQLKEQNDERPPFTS
jgi:hypothetical protein